jgi:hypothetical protein
MSSRAMTAVWEEFFRAVSEEEQKIIAGSGQPAGY